MQLVMCKTLWYSRLCHPSNQAIVVLHDDLQFTKDSHVSPCDICNREKQTRDPFPFNDHESTVIDELVDIDLCDHIKWLVRKGFGFFFSTVVDDYSTVVWIYLIKNKDEV